MQTRTADRIYSLADGEGQAYWFVGALLQRKAGGCKPAIKTDLRGS